MPPSTLGVAKAPCDASQEALHSMIDLKQSDVAPIIAQLCRDINKDFDSISGFNSKRAKVKETSQTSFQSQFEKLKKKFESRITPYGHKHKEKKNRLNDRQLRVFYFKRRKKKPFEWKYVNECDLFVYHVKQGKSGSKCTFDLPPFSSTNQQSKSRKLPAFLFFLPWSDFVLKNKKMCEFLKENENRIFYVLPSLKSDTLGSSDNTVRNVWICGNFRNKKDKIKLMVQKAIERRKKNQKFSTIAKNFEEVKKLMERYSNRMGYLFSKTNPKVREQLKLDDTAMYSVTDEITADEISAIMVEHIENYKNLAIIDATACVGGNLFSFARHYDKVLGVEINKERYEMLCHNWDVICDHQNEKIGVNSGTRIVEFLHGCCVGLLKKELPEEQHRFFQQDHVLFFDPPWGGVNYKSSAILETLTLSNTALVDVISMAFSKSNMCKAVVCKVPYNYNIGKFKKEDYNLFSLSKKVKLLIFHGFTGKVDSRKRKFEHTSDDATASNSLKIRKNKKRNKKKGTGQK